MPEKPQHPVLSNYFAAAVQQLAAVVAFERM
jgi:hypothetical protein